MLLRSQHSRSVLSHFCSHLVLLLLLLPSRESAPCLSLWLAGSCSCLWFRGGRGLLRPSRRCALYNLLNNRQFENFLVDNRQPLFEQNVRNTPYNLNPTLNPKLDNSLLDLLRLYLAVLIVWLSPLLAADVLPRFCFCCSCCSPPASAELL